jgi:hypothetical protein
MSDKGYVTVKVSVEGDKVTCDPEWARCFWEDGPDCVRWSVADADVPAEVSRVTVEWKDDSPPYKSGSPFSAAGYQPSPYHYRLPDIVTTGNRMEEGFYRYSLYCYDADGNVLASADPGVGNDSRPPGAPVP